MHRPEIDAIAALPDQAWTAAIEQHGEPVENAYVAELTGLLDLDAWQQKIPGLRVLVRDEPLHPRYRKRATDREKALGRRKYPGWIVANTQVGQIPGWNAPHVHVENNIKQAKDLGLKNRLALPLLDDQPRLDPDRCAGQEACWPATASSPSPTASYATPPRNCCATGCGSCPPGSPADNANAGCTCARTGPGPPT